MSPTCSCADPGHDDALARIVRRIDSRARLLRAWPLTGGVSAQMTGLELAMPDGATRTLILRIHGALDAGRDPRVAANEFRLLQTLRAAGFPAPEPVLLDLTLETLRAPYMVLGFIPGTALFDLAAKPDLVRELAAILVSIHAVTPATHDLSFLPVQDSGVRPRPDVLDDSLDESLIREAMARAWPLPPGNAPVLLHGDFWPGNVLWQDGQLAAIIDWEDARTGDPLVDLAKSRLEVLWAFGPDAMRRFTDRYLALMPHVDTTHLPYWELAAALEPAGNLGTWGLPPAKEQRFRRLHHQFVADALRRLAPG